MSTMIQVNLIDASSSPQQQTEMLHEKCLPNQWDLSFSENTLVPFYCFIKNFIGSSGGSSTVAIDNKIEQAMDLVKSHLMFAVREEVDVLKEKITELMDRISQLEHENGVLRANASPETLSKLSQSTHLSTQPQQSAPQPAPQSSQIPPQAATPLAVPQQPPQPQQQQHIQPAMVNTQSQTVPIPSQQQLSA